MKRKRIKVSKSRPKHDWNAVDLTRPLHKQMCTDLNELKPELIKIPPQWCDRERTRYIFFYYVPIHKNFEMKRGCTFFTWLYISKNITIFLTRQLAGILSCQSISKQDRWQSTDVPVEPRSAPPPSSILDQFGVDFPLDPPSPTTSRLSEDIGEWRLPTNLVRGHT